jgi:hypothetical protein
MARQRAVFRLLLASASESMMIPWLAKAQGFG